MLIYCLIGKSIAEKITNYDFLPEFNIDIETILPNMY